MPTQPLPGQPGFVVPAPQDRPRYDRRAVRVLVVDEADRVLLFQDAALFPWLSVEDNVRFGLKQSSRSRDDQHRIAQEWIDKVHLSGFEQAWVHQLSGGMRQRAALLRTRGYRVDVVEFVGSEHTPRNTLLRAAATGTPGDAAAAELATLTGTWQVTPRLAELLG